MFLGLKFKIKLNIFTVLKKISSLSPEKEKEEEEKKIQDK